MKTCTICHVTKQAVDFYVRSDGAGRPRSACKACELELRKTGRLGNLDKVRLQEKKRPVGQERAAHLRRSYNMTQAQYEAMSADQADVCYICWNPPVPGRVLCVDHDHTTGAVRALLCDTCNVMLGRARDNVAILRAAAD